MKSEILKQFEKHGNNASYHFADDSTKEWGLAREEEAAALKLFDENEELQPAMRKISAGFLWSLSRRRPL